MNESERRRRRALVVHAWFSFSWGRYLVLNEGV
jgi:hypothetical protein